MSQVPSLLPYCARSDATVGVAVSGTPLGHAWWSVSCSMRTIFVRPVESFQMSALAVQLRSVAEVGTQANVVSEVLSVKLSPPGHPYPDPL